MGIEGAAVFIQEGAQTGKAGLGIGLVVEVAALRMARRFNQQVIHATGAHVYVSLVRMEPVTGVPINSVEAKTQTYTNDYRQKQKSPGQASGERWPVHQVFKLGRNFRPRPVDGAPAARALGVGGLGLRIKHNAQRNSAAFSAHTPTPSLGVTMAPGTHTVIWIPLALSRDYLNPP